MPDVSRPAFACTFCGSPVKREVDTAWLPVGERAFVRLYHSPDGYTLDGDAKFLGVDWIDDPVRIEASDDAAARRELLAFVARRWRELGEGLGAG